MKSPTLLCPVDFSPSSQVAVEHAVEMAKAKGARLVLVNVAVPPPPYVSGYVGGIAALPTPSQPKPDPRLEEMKVPDASVILERVHLVGIEGESIVEYAENSGCDSIVMGTHGHRGIAKYLLGSVADYVMRHASCPVMVVKDSAREAAISQAIKAEELAAN